MKFPRKTFSNPNPQIKTTQLICLSLTSLQICEPNFELNYNLDCTDFSRRNSMPPTETPPDVNYMQNSISNASRMQLMELSRARQNHFCIKSNSI